MGVGVLFLCGAGWFGRPCGKKKRDKLLFKWSQILFERSLSHFLFWILLRRSIHFVSLGHFPLGKMPFVLVPESFLLRVSSKDPSPSFACGLPPF